MAERGAETREREGEGEREREREREREEAREGERGVDKVSSTHIIKN